MKKTLTAAVTVVFAALLAAPAHATTATPGADPCKIGTAWYGNPDEQDHLPDRTTAGFTFEGKDLIHHVAPSGGIDLADMDKVTYSFAATTAGKVVFKVETSAPYSTIVTNADGTLWSTAMTYDQDGGQGHPVTKYSDLVGKPTKPGKAPFTATSTVATFGVGYWVEDGSTVVTSITFHGTRYDLTCKPTPEPTKTSTSTSASPSASASTSTSPSVSATASSSPTAVPATGSKPGGGLPVTGPSGIITAVAGLILLSAGAVAVVAVRRRRTRFTA